MVLPGDDMKIAVMSDIHANLEALKAVLALIDGAGITSVYCLGDLVGYGPNPNECVQMIRDRNIPCVAGNHDKAVTQEVLYEGFNGRARMTIEWTRSVLTQENGRFLESLPYVIDDRECMFVHASPDAPEDFRYVLKGSDAERCFEYVARPTCFIGHTHQPALYSNGKKRMINVGSVGQPRDGDWRSCFALYDSETDDVNIIRTEYDVQRTCQKMLAARFSQHLTARLMYGV